MTSDSSSEKLEAETEGRRFPTVTPTIAAATFEIELAIEFWLCCCSCCCGVGATGGGGEGEEGECEGVVEGGIGNMYDSGVDVRGEGSL